MDDLLRKYEKQLGLTQKELRKMVCEALASDGYEQKMVDIFGIDNVEDIVQICTTFPKEHEQRSLHFDESDFGKYQENKFETITSRGMHSGASVPVSAVENGAKYFPFELFNHIQSITFDAVHRSDENLLISAPTGSGKTEVAILGILRANAREKGKIVYIAPMKALATEIAGKLRRILSEKVCEFTGDVEMPSGEARKNDVFVATPEKFEVVTRRHGNFFEASLKLLIIDEIHLLQDDRGGILESIVCRVFRYAEARKRPIRIIGISATLPNVEDVAQFIRATKFFKFDDSYRPVGLDISILGVYGARKKSGKRSEAATPGDIRDVCLAKIEELRTPTNQILVFTHSRPDVVFTARKIAQELLPKNAPEKVFENAIFNDLLSKEIGVHHAGLPRNVRHAMERLFMEKKIKVLVCTSTLAWGVNLPANIVIVKGTTFYDPQRGNFFDVSILDLIQIFGRAGRPQFGRTGMAVLITPKSKLATFTKLLSEKRLIESRFLSSLVDFLNAEICLGNVENIDGGLRWLKNTFFYVRMRKNPALYGMGAADDDIDDVLRDYLLLSVRKLRECRMVETRRSAYAHENAWRLATTEFGRIASFFYVHHETIALWLQRLPGVANEHGALFLVFESLEFRNIVCRSDEHDTLKSLADDFQIDFDDVAPTKMFILLIAAFRRTKLYSFSLACDQNYLVHNLKRVLRALILIVVESGRFDLFKIVLDLHARTRGLVRKSVAFDAKIVLRHAGPFLHVVTENCAEIGAKYALVRAQAKTTAVHLFATGADFFALMPESEFLVEIGGVDENWCVSRVFSLANIEKLAVAAELARYGAHECSETRWTFGTGIKTCVHFRFTDDDTHEKGVFVHSVGEIADPCHANAVLFWFSAKALCEPALCVAFEHISDHSDSEINFLIFNLLRETASPTAVVVASAAEKQKTAAHLRAMCAQRGGSFEIATAPSAKASKNKRVFVATSDEVALLSARHAIFKGCRDEAGCAPMAVVFSVACACPVTILEKKDFCDFAKRIFAC